MFDQDLSEYLKSEITEVSNRVYIPKAPAEPVIPFLNVSRVSSANQGRFFDSYTYQIEVITSTYSEGLELSDKIKNILHRDANVFCGANFVDVQGGTSMYENDIEAYRQIINIRVWR